MARQQQSFCRQMCCVCVERGRRWTSEADVVDLLKPSVCHQPSAEVPGRTKTSKRNMDVPCALTITAILRGVEADVFTGRIMPTNSMKHD